MSRDTRRAPVVIATSLAKSLTPASRSQHDLKNHGLHKNQKNTKKTTTHNKKNKTTHQTKPPPKNRVVDLRARHVRSRRSSSRAGAQTRPRSASARARVESKQMPPSASRSARQGAPFPRAHRRRGDQRELRLARACTPGNGVRRESTSRRLLLPRTPFRGASTRGPARRRGSACGALVTKTRDRATTSAGSARNRPPIITDDDSVRRRARPTSPARSAVLGQRARSCGRLGRDLPAPRHTHVISSCTGGGRGGKRREVAQ